MNVSAMMLTPAPFVHPTRWCTQANFLKGWPAEKPCVVPLLFFRKVAFEMPQCIAAMSPVSISTPPCGGGDCLFLAVYYALVCPKGV